MAVIPKGKFKGVKPFGAGAPTDSDYHKATLTNWQEYNPGGSAYRKYTLDATLQNGWKKKVFVNVPWDDNGNVVSGLSDKQVKGMSGALVTMLHSVGYTEADLDDDVDLGVWLTAAGRSACVKIKRGRTPTAKEKAAAGKPGGRLPNDCYDDIDFLIPSAWAYGKENEKEVQQATPAPDAPPTARRLPRAGR